jgi:outer membrane receptor protein involved in Fe transport
MEQKQVEFALPAMPLGEALRDVARQAGQNLVVDNQLVAGRAAPALSGRFTAQEAVQRLLHGSGLVSRMSEGTIIISRPLAAETRTPATSEAGQEIVVTGTHVRGAPTTSPVITVSRRQIDQSGVTSVEQLMRRLPQNQSAGVDQENFGVEGTGSDITQHGAGINLRGLGQRATLVLINGRRIAPSDTGSFVDVSLIPLSAVDRVEVLTDGASAIYGSDAVGGVVNFILRRNFSGVEPVVQVGTTTRGGGRELLAGLTAGDTWSGGHALLSYEYRDQSPIRAEDRAFTINLEPDWFLIPRERRHSLYGSFRQELTSNLALDLSGLFSTRHTQRTFFDASHVAIAGDAHARAIGGTAALQLDLGNSWLAEASAGYSRSRTNEQETQAGSLFNRSISSNAFTEFAAKADGSLIALPGGPLKLALGAAVRRERFENLFATPVNVPTTIRAGRTVSYAYGELNVPLFSARNRRPGFEQLTLTAAGRVERYEHVGSSFNPKVGLLWSPVAALRVRSSYGTSFRAPLLSESNGYYNVFLFPAALLYEDPSQATPGVAAAVVGNDPGVRPERSKAFSVGADFIPPSIARLKASATYYKISFTNRIALPSPQVALIGDPAFAAIVALNPQANSVADLFAGANQLLDFSGPGFTNGGATAADVVAVVDDRIANTAETRTSGLDLLLDYGFAAGKNDFHFELNANRVFDFNDKLTASSPWIHRLNTPYNPVAWRGRGGLSWQRGAIGLATFVNYVAAYRDNRGIADRRVRAFTTVDAGLTLDGSAAHAAWLRPLRLTLNALNLFDARPPRLAPGPGSSSGVGYDPVNASGQGRFVSLQLRGKW